MISAYAEKLIKRIPGLHEAGYSLSEALHRAILSGGEPARRVADVLHGTWLGHPLHPVMTDIPVGAWTLGTLFDGAAALSGSEEAERMGDTLLAVGIVAAVPTALAGMVDYSTIPEDATADGTLHALLNISALALFIASWRERRADERGRGLLLSMFAFTLTVVSAWLGGHLIYKKRVTVNHADQITKPETWTAILPADELRDGQPRRVAVEGKPALLYRYGGTVYAIGATCSHAGGPLDEGKFDGFCVECPWHQSVFDLRDGRNVHGPATYPQPLFAARIQNGQIEVRVERAEEAY